MDTWVVGVGKGLKKIYLNIIFYLFCSRWYNWGKSGDMGCGRDEPGFVPMLWNFESGYPSKDPIYLICRKKKAKNTEPDALDET